jgi:hypothetical protein
MKRCTALLALLLYTFAAGCSRTVGRHTAEAKPAPTAEDLCITNLAIIWGQLHAWNFYDPLPPTNLDELLWVITNANTSVISNANTFVCPASAHSPGSWTNIESWTDYIYFDLGHSFDAPPSDIPLLICPSQNHHGQFANIVWISGNIGRLSPKECASLIKEPWLRVEVYESDIELYKSRRERVKAEIHVRVPKRWKKAYPDAYAPDKPHQPGGRPDH